MNDAINLLNVTKQYPKFTLSDISMDLPAGYIMGLIGPNGAGKTTLIKLILNMIKRNSGEISVFGLDVLQSEHTIKEQIGVVFDSHYFVETWTLREISSVMKLFYETWDESKYEKWLKDYQLNADMKVRDLSKGQQMKLMLACAFSHDSKLLILDEPTSGLDSIARDDLLDTLSDYIQDGEHSVLFSTHITSDLEQIADYITFIDQGKLLYSGLKDEFIDSFRLVKGGNEDLSAALKADLTGYRQHAAGFEGILHTEKAASYPDLLISTPTIDEIIVFTYRGNGKQ